MSLQIVVNPKRRSRERVSNETGTIFRTVLAFVVASLLIGVVAMSAPGTTPKPMMDGPALSPPLTDCDLEPGDTSSVRKYWPAPGTPVQITDQRCSPVSILHPEPCSLSGWLYTPSAPHPPTLPVLIYTHGSGNVHPEACEMINLAGSSSRFTSSTACSIPLR